MATRICFGIPHRVGACACELGKGREEQGVIEATETTTQFENIVANKPIDPGHKIISVAYADNLPADGQNDDATRLAVAISAWKGYPEQSETDPKIIIKTKGDVSEGVSGSFPSIKITLRPLKTVLDYEYAGNLNASGQGEVGYESQNGADDLIAANYWEGKDEIPRGEGQDAAYIGNQDDFAYYIYDVTQGGPMITLTETHYFKSADRPGDEPTPWQPLTGLELDPDFKPRLPSMDSFAFGRNESFDCRYRFPQNYLTKFGSMTMPQNTFLVTLPAVPEYNIDEIPQGDWDWKTLTQIDPSFQPPLNPIFEPDNNDIFISADYIKEGVAPVIKGWYWDSQTPPTNGLKGLFQSTNFKMTKEVRKRYPFSFVAKESREEDFRVVDHRPGNQMLREDNEAAGTGYFRREPAFYGHSLTKDNSFKALAWWRMEIDSELCGWNSKKIVGFDPETQQETTTVVGATIKGYIKLGIKILQPSYSEQGLYSQLYTVSYGQNFWDRWTGISRSFVYRCKVEPYFDENFIQRYEILEYDGGEIPWEVTLDEDNSKGKPIKFLDFPITSQAELPGQNPPPPGTVPDNTLVFIKDFVVTEVILP
jgi:hypothetical protein